MTLKEMRFSKQMTQVKLSQLAGINPATLSHIENYVIEPSKKQKEAIEAALQLPEGCITWERIK